MTGLGIEPWTPVFLVRSSTTELFIYWVAQSTTMYLLTVSKISFFYLVKAQSI